MVVEIVVPSSTSSMIFLRLVDVKFKSKYRIHMEGSWIATPCSNVKCWMWTTCGINIQGLPVSSDQVGYVIGDSPDGPRVSYSEPCITILNSTGNKLVHRRTEIRNISMYAQIGIIGDIQETEPESMYIMWCSDDQENQGVILCRCRTP